MFTTHIDITIRWFPEEHAYRIVVAEDRAEPVVRFAPESSDAALAYAAGQAVEDYLNGLY